MSLRGKTISGLFWTFSQQFSVKAINFVVQIVLARILLPEDFGLIAMLSVFMAIGSTLMDSGLTSSLIRTKEADEQDFSTVFYMNLVASLLVYLLIFVSAPFIALFFNQPLLEDIVRVYTLTFVIRAFSQVQNTRLTKAMNFKLQMTIQIPSVIIGGGIGILLAYRGMGVWALVWMNIVQAILSSLQLWLRSGWTPKFIFNMEKLRYHFNFGYKLTLSGLLNTIFTNVYNLVIGKYFSAAQLGYYNRADTLRMFPVLNLSSALNKVTYPMFASIQDDNVKLRKAYQILMQQVLYWLAPVMALLIVLAEPLFRFILTEKWLPAVPYFQLLCLSGVLYPIHAYNLNILNVKGRSDLFLRLEIIKKAIIAVGIICAVPFGIYGLLYFQLVSTVLAYFINTHYSGRMINYSTGRQFLDIIPTLVLAAGVGVIAWILYIYMISRFCIADIGVILLIGIVYMFCYLSISIVLKFPAFLEFKRLFLARFMKNMNSP
ncbi:lipopolysaccharide biosynthesis protein [Parapedobacter sp. 10938]|uniref:lipopolysaccharide biosynthesis protein n=1 Tax=Parapedobacter flavus TaxID=3110225 RepID=UPI002DB8C9D0|nr:lipopolysaccharide biosynthesis protein [Parapedobacter sp. 10938]MEC3880155.1 lipopolysaccharide biosynthesis protein [Parapedobacter sp. 10938]